MNKKEVLKYLRTCSTVEDSTLLALIDEFAERAYRCIQPKTIYSIFPCQADARGVEIAGVYFPSCRLAENLKGCRQVVAFAATLGTEADRLLRAAKTEGTAQLMICQAVLAAITEEVCDKLEEQIKAAHGVRLRRRYSPGYYDLALESQRDFFTLMDITKRIGITLSDSLLMIPSKSVTALIGIENEA